MPQKDPQSKKALREIVELEHQRLALSQLMVLVPRAIAIFEASKTFLDTSTTQIMAFRDVLNATAVGGLESSMEKVTTEMRRLAKSDTARDSFEQQTKNVIKNTPLEPEFSR